jgi:lipoprotein-anchoring transpeptidase ErfK/SrfK
LPFTVDHYVELDRPLDFGEHFWDESFARANGAHGSAQIVVDLEAEQLYVYRSGIEIARTKITRGWEEYDTPTGIFPILEKDADHYSSSYDNAPMPYNLRLTWKGVAIHGAEVDSLSATHGCIGVPLEFARKLFANVRKGDKVLVTRNWRPEVY